MLPSEYSMHKIQRIMGNPLVMSALQTKLVSLRRCFNAEMNFEENKTVNKHDRAYSFRGPLPIKTGKSVSLRYDDRRLKS
jgi:hypothetical protein